MNKNVNQTGQDVIDPSMERCRVIDFPYVNSEEKEKRSVHIKPSHISHVVIDIPVPKDDFILINEFDLHSDRALHEELDEVLGKNSTDYDAMFGCFIQLTVSLSDFEEKVGKCEEIINRYISKAREWGLS